MAKGPVEQFPDFPFPSVILDTLIKERVSSFVGNYKPQEPGTPFAGNQDTHTVADVASFAGTISLGQRATGDDNEWFERYWATIPHTQDIYNYEQDTSSEISGYPGFIRRYLELRDQYPSLIRTSLTPFTGLYAVRITAAGLGYDPINPPNVTCNNGATAIAVVDPSNGSIAKITLKAEGANCTTSVTIAAPPVGGTQATAVGILQPANCLLVSEKAVPAPEQWTALYLLVTRQYKTLPGPIRPYRSVMGSTGIPILVSEQEVAATALFQDGEFLPAALNVSIISTGASPLVTLTSDHGLPVGAYVTFAGTGSTPPLGTTPLRIVSVPASNQVTVTPANPVTIAGGMTGTMQSTNWITREIQLTENGNVNMKVESMFAGSDITIYNEDIETSEQYPFPNYLESIILYADTSFAIADTLGSSASISASWGGAVGLPTQAGYRGPCDGSRRRRYYFVGPPPDSFTNQFKSTVIIPSIGTFVIKGGSFSRSATTSGSVSRSSSNNYRTGVIGAVLTGPNPQVISTAPTINISSVVITGGPTPLIPKITLASNHGMTGNAFVSITGTGTILDNVWQLTAVPSANSFQVTLPTPLSAALGAVGKAQILTTTGAYGAGVATVALDLPVSHPAKIISTLIINTIGTGALPLITLSADHYLKSGQVVELEGTTCTPSLNGFWQITTVPASNQITVTPPASITGAQSSPAGTLQNYIVLIDQPAKLGTAALWQWYVKLIKVPYTSGDPPP